MILTLYELSEGDLAANEGTTFFGRGRLTVEFRGMDSTLLKKVLQILVKRGVATIFKGTDGEETGVKFFGST